MARQRGGYRKPANPAAPGTSGPGAFSRRTDGGPSAPSRIPSEHYGQGTELARQQAGAPTTGPSGGSPATQPSPSPASAFGPTQRPAESNRAGLTAPRPPAPDPDNVQTLLRAMYSINPTTYLEHLLRKL